MQWWSNFWYLFLWDISIPYYHCMESLKNIPFCSKGKSWRYIRALYLFDHHFCFDFGYFKKNVFSVASLSYFVARKFPQSLFFKVCWQNQCNFLSKLSWKNSLISFQAHEGLACLFSPQIFHFNVLRSHKFQNVHWKDFCRCM